MKDLRADARRNRELLLHAARQAFVQSGIDVSLEQISQRAGVGNGTLYRNFSNRDHLYANAFAAEFRFLAEQIDVSRFSLGQVVAHLTSYFLENRDMSKVVRNLVLQRTQDVPKEIELIVKKTDEIMKASGSAFSKVLPDELVFLVASVCDSDDCQRVRRLECVISDALDHTPSDGGIDRCV